MDETIKIDCVDQYKQTFLTGNPTPPGKRG